MVSPAWPEIRSRIAAGEDEHTELKLWEGFPNKVAAAVCALANSDGGLIILGIDDAGAIVGVDEDPDEVQEKLTNLLQTGLTAPVRASLGCHLEDGVWVHWIDVRRYRGPEPLRHDRRVLVRRGRIDEQVERALGWFKALGMQETYGDDQRRVDRPLVPLRALREGLVNAVVHRDYAILGSKVLLEVFADRVDVTSPGELPNHMTVATALAGGHPRSRNELLAHFMTVMGWMELRGRGLPIIRQEMREANGTEPRLDNNLDGRFVRLSLRIRADATTGGG